MVQAHLEFAQKNKEVKSQRINYNKTFHKNRRK